MDTKKFFRLEHLDSGRGPWYNKKGERDNRLELDGVVGDCGFNLNLCSQIKGWTTVMDMDFFDRFQFEIISLEEKEKLDQLGWGIVQYETEIWKKFLVQGCYGVKLESSSKVRYSFGQNHINSKITQCVGKDVLVYDDQW